MPTAAPAVKSFHVAARATLPDAEREPLPFQFDYTDAQGEEQKSPVFKARPWNIRQVVLLELPNMISEQNTAAMFRVFRDALGDDWPAFDRFVHGPDVDVQADHWIEILQWLLEDATGRPTGPS